METKQRDMNQLQEMENEFKHLTSQQELINQQLIDLNISKEAILELKKTKQDTSSISSSILAKVLSKNSKAALFIFKSSSWEIEGLLALLASMV